MPPRHLLLHRQKLGHLSKHYIFYCFMHYAFFLERQLFLFLVFFCFVCCNKCLDHIMCLERDMLRFSFAKNTLFFTLIVQRVFSFSATAFSLHFLPWFFFQILLYLCIKVYFDLWSMLVFIKRVVSKKFEWCWKREKVSCKKVVQKGACVDCGLCFCTSCLIYFW
jgi:hypothetical protein